MRILLIALLSLASASAETLQGNFRYMWANLGTAPVGAGSQCNSAGSVCMYAEANDADATTTAVTVKLCWSASYIQNVTQTDAVWSNGNCTTTTTRQAFASPLATVAGVSGGGSAFQYPIPAPGVSVGSIQPSDGGQYYLYAKILSTVSSPANDKVIDDSPWPYKYALSSGGYNSYAAPWPVNAMNVPGRFTADSFVGIGNVLDTYSVGQSSGGNVVCSVSWGHQSGTVYDNGALGEWIAGHSVPCDSNHVILTSVTVSQFLQSTSTAAVNLLADIAATGRQAIAIGWAQPSVIATGINGAGQQESICGFLSYGGFVPGNASSTSAAAYHPYNPYFNSASKTPFTDHSIRPSMLLAAGHCTSGCADTNNPAPAGTWTEQASAFASVISAALAATDSNPTTGKTTVVYTGDTKRSMPGAPYIQSFAGTPGPINTSRIAASVYFGYSSTGPGTLSNPANASLCTLSILCITTAVNYSFTSSSDNPFLSGVGVAWNVSSSGADIPTDTAGGQASALGWIAHGAVAVYGSATEPGQVPAHFPDSAVFLRKYTEGSTVVEALWKSVLQPWEGNFIGDPLAAPFTLASSTTTTLSTTLHGITLRGVTVH